MLPRRGDGSTIDGFLEVAEAEGWEVVPVTDYSALPSGTVEHAVFELFWGELDAGLEAALANGGLDGIWLALHGAMVTTESVDPEGELLARIRAVPGAETPAAVRRLRSARHLHRRHGDARQRPRRLSREPAHRRARVRRALGAAAAPARSANGVLPHMFARNAPIIWAPTGVGTADRPMRDLEALARQIEAENPEIWTVNVVAGYSFSDIPDAGVAFSVTTTGSDADAEAALDRLEQLAIELRELGIPTEWDLDAALAEVKAVTGGPYIIVEPSDNIGGGAPGDGTAVLRGFLRHGIANAAVAIADPAAVRALADAKPGEKRTLSIGGKGSRLDPGPVELEVDLRQPQRRRLHPRGPQQPPRRLAGHPFRHGPVRRGRGRTASRILLTSRKTPPFDLGQLRSQGIIPRSCRSSA